MEIPKNAVQVHLYDVKNVLMPRGSMEKESIGTYLEERLSGAFESWTDEKYGDNPTEEDLMELLHKNLMGEVAAVWNSFVKKAIK